jgi:tetratricopeptide (TPR) repeat protein
VRNPNQATGRSNAALPSPGRSQRRSRIPSGVGFAAGLFAVALLVAGAYRLGPAFARARSSSADRAELTYFPSGPWVRAAALGRSRLAADLCWLEAIQYYGKHRQSDQRYDYAETLFRTLTDLDPGFENAYVFGALVLHGDVGAPQAAFALLDRGMARNPSSWRLAFERGFLAYLTAKGSPEAVQYLSRSEERRVGKEC